MVVNLLKNNNSINKNTGLHLDVDELIKFCSPYEYLYWCTLEFDTGLTDGPCWWPLFKKNDESVDCLSICAFGFFFVVVCCFSFFSLANRFMGFLSYSKIMKDSE